MNFSRLCMCLLGYLIGCRNQSPKTSEKQGENRRCLYLTEKIIQNAIDDLPARFKQVIILRDIQELSYEEIGSILHIPLGTVKSRVNRARLKLQSKLKDIKLPLG